MILRIKTFILLLITVTYILSFPGIELNAFSPSELEIPFKHNVPQILAMEVAVSSLFTQSEESSKPAGPVQVIQITKQFALENSIRQSEINYSINNDLNIYHPFIIYKISLSAHTSDG
jgi:hypothetical protein